MLLYKPALWIPSLISELATSIPDQPPNFSVTPYNLYAIIIIEISNNLHFSSPNCVRKPVRIDYLDLLPWKIQPQLLHSIHQSLRKCCIPKNMILQLINLEQQHLQRLIVATSIFLKRSAFMPWIRYSKSSKQQDLMWSEQIEWTEQQILDIVKASQDDQHIVYITNAGSVVDSGSESSPSSKCLLIRSPNCSSRKSKRFREAYSAVTSQLVDDFFDDWIDIDIERVDLTNEVD